MIAMGPGKGGCGNCGSKLEVLRSGPCRLAICSGCGIVVGEGPEAAKLIAAEIAEGRAKWIEAAPGFSAMVLTGLPVV